MADGAFNINFEVNLMDTKSVNNALELLELFPRKTDLAIKNAMAELADRIEKRLIQELATFGLAGSSIASSIIINRYDDGISIAVTSDYAMFVEFGTGIIGQTNPHPNLSFGGEEWMYDVNDHGISGWWYPTTESDPNPTKKYDANKNTWFAWTAGQEAKPFMYRTWRYARLIATKTVNKHLRRVFE